MRISDWSSDVCSSDLGKRVVQKRAEAISLPPDLQRPSGRFGEGCLKGPKGGRGVAAGVPAVRAGGDEISAGGGQTRGRGKVAGAEGDLRRRDRKSDV